uniref:Uncharacterized protein n=1 Tax=Oryza rufipogon TaxID=4529 RepID=A0A0E0PCX8_ORYRU
MEEQVRKAVFLNRETFGSQFALAISRIPYSVVEEYTSTGLEELFADVGTWKKQRKNKHLNQQQMYDYQAMTLRPIQGQQTGTCTSDHLNKKVAVCSNLGMEINRNELGYTHLLLASRLPLDVGAYLERTCNGVSSKRFVGNHFTAHIPLRESSADRRPRENKRRERKSKAAMPVSTLVTVLHITYSAIPS